MARDPLLEEIRESLWDRIDHRLAAVLAVSVGGHLALAIAAWLGDPPADRPWLDTTSEAVYEPQVVDELMMIPEAAPAPGIATPVTPSPAPAPARATARTATERTRRPAPPPPAINATALVDELVGDGPSFRDAGRRSPGKDLDRQLVEAQQRANQATVGGNGVEETHAIGGGHDPLVGDPDGPVGAGKLPEAPPPRTIFDDPDPGIDYDPSDDVRANRMRSLKRCYLQELQLDPDLRGRVDLEFTIGVTGKVTAARATGLAGVASCVERLARGWQFPVELPGKAEFGMALIFIPH